MESYEKNEQIFLLNVAKTDSLNLANMMKIFSLEILDKAFKVLMMTIGAVLIVSYFIALFHTHFKYWVLKPELSMN